MPRLGGAALIAHLQRLIDETSRDLGALDFNYEMQRRARLDRIEHLSRELTVAIGARGVVTP